MRALFRPNRQPAIGHSDAWVADQLVVIPSAFAFDSIEQVVSSVVPVDGLRLLEGERSGETHDFLRHVRPTAYTVTNMHGQLVRLPLPPLPYPIPLSPVTGLVATPKEMSNMLLACLQVRGLLRLAPRRVVRVS